VSQRTAAGARDWLRLLRPQQWVKNAFVLAPLLFSGRALEPGFALRAGLAMLYFCLAASAIYAWNDVVDQAGDRLHPLKRHRPVAAGRIRSGAAIGAGLGLATAALAGGAALSPLVGLLIASYLGINLLYTLTLKRLVILDVFAISASFLLRLLAGSAAISVHPSIWLLLCGGLLTLYLGFAKRRHELGLLGENSSGHRSVLAEYSLAFLDQMSVVLLSVTIVCYIMYTVSPEKVAEIGSHALAYSVVFVLYGVFRYLYLVHQRQQGSPSETLLTDRALFLAVVLWAIYCGWVIYRPR
jgi:4-hydroxybenzoate polyprenyltransferase